MLLGINLKRDFPASPAGFFCFCVFVFFFLFYSVLINLTFECLEMLNTGDKRQLKSLLFD